MVFFYYRKEELSFNAMKKTRQFLPIFYQNSANELKIYVH